MKSRILIDIPMGHVTRCVRQQVEGELVDNWPFGKGSLSFAQHSISNEVGPPEFQVFAFDVIKLRTKKCVEQSLPPFQQKIRNK